MGGDSPLVPELMETVARSYAVQILAKKKSLADVPGRPDTLKPRVEYLVSLR